MKEDGSKLVWALTLLPREAKSFPQPSLPAQVLTLQNILLHHLLFVLFYKRNCLKSCTETRKQYISPSMASTLMFHILRVSMQTPIFHSYNLDPEVYLFATPSIFHKDSHSFDLTCQTLIILHSKYSSMLRGQFTIKGRAVNLYIPTSYIQFELGMDESVHFTEPNFSLISALSSLHCYTQTLRKFYLDTRGTVSSHYTYHETDTCTEFIILVLQSDTQYVFKSDAVYKP